MTYREVKERILETEPKARVKTCFGTFVEVYEIDGNYYDANGFELTEEEIKTYGLR